MTTRKHADDVVGSKPFNELVAGVDGLTFGYIGNVGINYDDRTFFVWTELRYTDGNRNLKALWSGDILTRRELCAARRAVEAYKMGLQFAKEGATPFYATN